MPWWYSVLDNFTTYIYLCITISLVTYNRLYERTACLYSNCTTFPSVTFSSVLYGVVKLPVFNKSHYKKGFSLSDVEYRCGCLTGDEPLCGWWSSMKYLARRHQYLRWFGDLFLEERLTIYFICIFDCPTHLFQHNTSCYLTRTVPLCDLFPFRFKGEPSLLTIF